MNNTTTETNYRMELFEKAMSRRNWKDLPASFEMDAVKALFNQELKGLFNRSEISKRIKASRATTFEELKGAL